MLIKAVQIVRELTFGEPNGNFVPREAGEYGHGLKVLGSDKLLGMILQEFASIRPVDHGGKGQTGESQLVNGVTFMMS